MWAAKSSPTAAITIGEATLADFAASMRGTTVQPGDEDYDRERSIWNGAHDRHPAVIARCAGVADVIRTVDLARSEGLPLAVRGPFLPESVHGTPIIGIGACWSGDLDAGEAATAPFRSLGIVIADVFAANPYAGWQQALDPLYPRGVHNYWRSALLRAAEDASLRVLIDSSAARPTALTEIHL